MGITNWFRSHLGETVLTFTLVIICLQNFTLGTYLAGWDNLMPELNIWLNLKRSLLAVWQEYQGLGLVGGMGHATDLIRQLIILPFTLLLPLSTIRYLWHFAMLFLGTFGVYLGLKNMKRSRPFPSIVSFLASLFYLLNFGTVQYFWAPLETFSTFWGFFPWLIFYLWDYLQNPKSLKKLILINILAIPSFYVQTIFIVYIICVFLILLSHFIFNKHISSLKLYSSIILMLFLVNSFWLLPQIYFLSNSLKNPTAGIGNFMSTDDSFARNQARGYPSDFFVLQNYYLDFPDTEGLFMAPWVSHYANQYIVICGYVLSSFVFFGFIYLLSRPKKLGFKELSILLFLLLGSIALLSATPPFAQVNSLLRQFGIINQIFRAPFTKFIVPTVFTFSLLTAFGIDALIKFFAEIKYSPKVFTPILVTTYCLLIGIYSFPVFQGNLISPKFRRQIPTEYFELFKYFQAQSSSARIANLPSGSFWGWTNYRWGYRGSGFLWYALPQPIIDRAFDAWNLNNEQYYWELNQALQKKDPYLLSRIFQKYSIEYVILDNNVFFPDEFIYSKINVSVRDLLLSTPNITQEKQFGNIGIYRTSIPTKSYLLHDPISTSNSNFFYEDGIFQQHSDYVSATDNNLNYPFLNLFTNRLQDEFSYNIKLKQGNIIITNKLDFSAVSIPQDDSINQYKNVSLPANTSDNSHILTSRHDFRLLAYNFPSASLGKSYLVKVDYQHLNGLPLTISINSDNLQHKYVATRLNRDQGRQTAWFVIPAEETSDFNQGITILLNNNSLNWDTTKNQVFDVNLYPIPFYDLIQQSDSKSESRSSRTYTQSDNHLFFYKITFDSSTGDSTYLTLPQSYSPGWLAFYFDNYKIKFLPDHVVINNWANGWQINPELVEGQSIYLLFWPQLLEFAGFGLLFLTLIYTFHQARK